MRIVRKLLGWSSTELTDKVAQILADPIGILSAEALRIRPYNLLPVLLLPLVLVTMLGMMWLLGASPILIVVVGATTGGYWVLCLLKIFPSREVVIRIDGAELRRGKQVVWCPWSLFEREGKAVSSSPDQLSTLTLPIKSEAVHQVELRDDYSVVATGYEVRTRHFWFPSPTQVAIFNGTELESTHLGPLLMQLGSKLGTPYHAKMPPELNRYQEAQIDPTLGNGWVRVEVTKQFFPLLCCGCGSPPEKSFETIPFSWGGRFLALVTLGHVHELGVSVLLPVCKLCKKRSTIRARVGNAIFWIGLVSWLVAGVVLLCSLGSPIPVFVFLVLSVPIVVFSSDLVNYFTSPVQTARYDRKRNAVFLKFRWAEYAIMVRKLQSNTLPGNDGGTS